MTQWIETLDVRVNFRREKGMGTGISSKLRATAAIVCAFGLVTAVVAETGGSGAVQSLPTAPVPLCMPGDQLACACDENQTHGANALVTPCFRGDLDRQVSTQTDPFAFIVFSALNWPKAAARGEADFAANPGRTGSAPDFVTVWDSWPNTRALFRVDGGDPGTWSTALTPLPAPCQAIDLAGAQQAQAWAKVPSGGPVHVLDSFLNPDDDALIDLAGQPVRYEVMFNRQAFDYVTENRLWDPGGLTAYLASDKANGGRLAFPMGHWTSTARSRGAIVVKAAWKILDQGRDDPDHFHKAWAFVSPVITEGQVKPDACEVRPVGLIGMHIALKTKEFPDWLWATFEHLAIAPTWDDLVEDAEFAPGYDEPQSATTRWLFYTPQKADCVGAQNCGALAELNMASKATGTPIPTTPSRITRMQKPGYYFSQDAGSGRCGAAQATKGAGPLNDVLATYHDMECLFTAGFKDSVMVYYQLKGAQWFNPGLDGRHVPEPDVLANAALESFSQAQSSCLGCHADARPAHSTSNLSVFDYIFAVGRDGLVPGSGTATTTTPAANN